MNVDALTRAQARLGETAFDQTLWPEILQDIAESVGAFGAMLLQGGVPTLDAPWSPSLSRMREVYYRDGWNARDLRAIRSIAAVRRGLTVLADEDLVSCDEVRQHPYYTSFLSSQRLTAFAAITFRPSPADICGLVIQRTARQGEFTDIEKLALARLQPSLKTTAKLTQMIAAASLRSSLASLDHLSMPAIALGRTAAVLDANAAAAALYDDDFAVRAGAIVMRDERAAVELQRACDRARPRPDTTVERSQPIIVRRRGRLPLILRCLPLEGAAASFMSGAALLVTVANPSNGPKPSLDLSLAVFGMTRAEARLANHLATGLSLREAADVSGIKIETARTQLKVVFAKTGTRRQAELAILLGRL